MSNSWNNITEIINYDNFQKYRKLVINESEWDYVLFNVENIEKYKWLHSEFRISLDTNRENHPLVNKHQAFWIYNNTLCIGYTLKKKKEIYRPIFSYTRAILINTLLSNIPVIVKKREETIRKLAFIEIKKLVKIPIVIVKKIVYFII